MLNVNSAHEFELCYVTSGINKINKIEEKMMRRKVMFCAVVAVVSLFFVVNFAQANIFGLDGNVSPGAFPSFGAEDPFGFGTYGGTPAPSPSLLVGPFTDSDVLMAGQGVPAKHLSFNPFPFWINAFSDNTEVYDDIVKLDFSVDRISSGLAGTAVNTQFGLNQQPGDIFRTTRTLPAPAIMLPLMGGVGYMGPLPSAGVGGGNALLLDESALTLTAMGVPGVLVDSSVPAIPIAAVGTHDNVDSFEHNLFDTDGDMKNDTWMYFSINPDEALIMTPSAPGISAADIFDIKPAGVLGNLSNNPFAAAASMGLDMHGPDDIDALVMYDLDVLGGPCWGGPGAQPDVDYALFSLSHGSASLINWGLSEADIFLTNFTGSFALYASAADLGLIGRPGLEPGDNVDALEIIPEPTTIALLGLGILALRRKRKA